MSLDVLYRCNATRRLFRSITLERQPSLDSITCEISETCILRYGKTRYVNGFGLPPQLAQTAEKAKRI